jgi:hypothetical protein
MFMRPPQPGHGWVACSVAAALSGGCPRIELVQPREPSHSPMRFQLKFQSFGGVAVNIDSLRVVYLKTPEIDITPRVARFAKAIGVDIPDAEIPAGEHYIRVEVADFDGRTRSSIFVLKVVP